MGVLGSFCRVCGLPMQHDHFVPAGGMLKIYRGSSPNGGHTWAPGERVVQFGPEHAWLADAIAITNSEAPRVVAGRIEDGRLTSGQEQIFVGYDEAFAVHRFCWTQIGSPQSYRAAVTAQGILEYARAEVYQGQLFEFGMLNDHGKGWMLVDPTVNARNRQRIDALASAAREKGGGPRRVVDIIDEDNDWCGVMSYGENSGPSLVIHYRAAAHPTLEDLADFPHLVWAMIEYGQGMPSPQTFEELDQYEVALKNAVEANRRAIMVMSTVGEGHGQFLVQARDEAETCATIRALPEGTQFKAVVFENETDSTWSTYFDDMRPPPRF